MRLQFAQGHRRTDRRAVMQDMQVAGLEVRDTLAVRTFYVGIPNIPFFRYDPVEDSGPGRHLMDFQRNSIPNHSQSPPESVTGDASANRIELMRKSVQFRADFCCISLVECFQQAHRFIQSPSTFCLAPKSLPLLPA